MPGHASRCDAGYTLPMQQSHDLVHSPQLNRNVHVWSFGSFGPPLLVFPSAAGFAHEWKAQGMVEALAPLLQAGRLKLYCPESNVSEGWTDKDAHPADRIKRHQAYEAFIVQTLVPAIRKDCRSPDIPVAVTGCSLGAMFAATFALKHPDVFRAALCMSGRYAAKAFTNGFTNGDIYFDDPLAFVPNLDGPPLDRVRQTHLTLVCGRGKYEEGCIEETIGLAEICRRKSIPHALDLWGRDVSHDWTWWRRQVVHHVAGAFGRRIGVHA